MLKEDDCVVNYFLIRPEETKDIKCRVSMKPSTCDVCSFRPDEAARDDENRVIVRGAWGNSVIAFPPPAKWTGYSDGRATRRRRMWVRAPRAEFTFDYANHLYAVIKVSKRSHWGIGTLNDAPALVYFPLDNIAVCKRIMRSANVIAMRIPAMRITLARGKYVSDVWEMSRSVEQFFLRAEFFFLSMKHFILN